jgi:hypothetical protein
LVLALVSALVLETMTDWQLHPVRGKCNFTAACGWTLLLGEMDVVVYK